MKMITLETTCDKCNSVNKKKIKMYQPEDFSKDGTGSVLSQMWCPKCRAAMVVRYKFVRKTDKIVAQIIDKYEADSIFVPREPEPGITIRPRLKRRG